MRLLAMLAVLWAAVARAGPEDLPDLEATLRARFPDVRWITPAELRPALAAPPAERPLLLDVREEEEFAVSHLPDARRALTLDEALAALGGVSLDRPIVTYCAVGYRSGKLTQALTARGFTNVRNLQGAIFAWAHLGLPLERDGRPAHTVHPYDARWGRYLRPALRAPLD